MDHYYVIPGALIITLIIMLIVSLFSKRPMRGLWIFFLIVFLATWAGPLWITPFGPLVWGVAWLPMFLISFFFWFLILALIPPLPPPSTNTTTAEEASFAAIGLFYWIILILLIASIAIGYYRLP
jgi:hypothetical protein